MDDDKFVLVLAFFGLMAFFAFISFSNRGTTLSATSQPLLVEKDEDGRIVSITPQ